LLIGLLTLTPFWIMFWIWRWRARQRLVAWLHTPRAWPRAWGAEWRRSGWLAPGWELADLPAELSLTQVLYDWAWADPDVLEHLSLRGAPVGGEQVGLEPLLSALWVNLPEPARAATQERLAARLRASYSWWTGAEHGWTGRPLLMDATRMPKASAALPLVAVEDLTAAPIPGPFRVEKLISDAPAPLWPLLLALQRRTPPRFMHPLAVSQGEGESLVAGLSHKVGTTVGQRIGAGLGSILGPIGSMLGQHVGGMLGAAGAKQLAGKMVSPQVETALEQVSVAISGLGATVTGKELARGLMLPEKALLDLGAQWQKRVARRGGRLRERLARSVELTLAEECLVLAADALRGYRDAQPVFFAIAEKGGDLVTGGLVLQNPWMATAKPEAAERLQEARAALNRAAQSLGQLRPRGSGGPTR
jgi:hypothetical protein